MYLLINENILPIIESIESDHVEKYDWLIANIRQMESDEYQTKYKTFWRLHGAGLSRGYCSAYFQFLQEHLENPIEIKDLIMMLYNIPVNSLGKRKIQFSFVTKMLHMADRSLPIYDSLISTFYFFKPNNRLSTDKKIDELISFYAFLNAEYHRIIKISLLRESIETFRNHFNPVYFTDEKVIDSLIWAFTAYAFKGAIVNKHIIFR